MGVFKSLQNKACDRFHVVTVRSVRNRVALIERDDIVVDSTDYCNTPIHSVFNQDFFKEPTRKRAELFIKAIVSPLDVSFIGI